MSWKLGTIKIKEWNLSSTLQIEFFLIELNSIKFALRWKSDDKSNARLKLYLTDIILSISNNFREIKCMYVNVVKG